jgi:hypothetical protein
MAGSSSTTWAKVVGQSITAPTPTTKLFARTECAVSLTPFLTKKTPPPSGRFPIFYDLSSSQASQEEIAEVLPPGILGLVWREDMDILEVDVLTEDEQNTLLSSPLTFSQHSPLTLLPSKVNLPWFVLVKLANVPIAAASTLEVMLRRHWETFGKVVALGPHRIPGKPWLTRRWDVVLELAPSSSFTPPTIFEIFGQKVLAWWPRAPETCLTCKTVGHTSSGCPRRKQKVGTPTPPSNPQKSAEAVSHTAPESGETKSRQKRKKKKKPKHQSEKPGSTVGQASGSVPPIPATPEHHTTTATPTQTLYATTTPTLYTTATGTPVVATSPVASSSVVTSTLPRPVFGPHPPPPTGDNMDEDFEFDSNGELIYSSPVELARFLERSGTPTPKPRHPPSAGNSPSGKKARR